MNNMKETKMYYFLIVVFFLYSCVTHDGATYSKTFAINNSGYEITIEPYYEGKVFWKDVIIIAKTGKTEILSQRDPGKGQGLSYGRYLLPMDSVIIRFEGKYEVTHYKRAPIGNTIKRVLYESNRNIFNPNNYTRQILSESKHSITDEYTFEFTLQDYLDAQ